MPEGIEVRISAELIRPIVKGLIITGMEISPTSRYSNKEPEGFKEFSEYLGKDQSVSIIDVSARGKFMWWEFTNHHYMMCTFGMSGQWSPIKGKHPCLTIKYINDKEREVHFNDPRHFGTISFTNSFANMNERRARLGWDPLNDGMHEKWFNYLLNNKLAKTNKPIGQVLMDQGLFAGVGNYIRAEALYLAKMSPWRASNTLKKEEFQTLCQALIHVMNDSYKHQGATILTYKDAYGAEGKYSSCFKVYGQKQDPLGNPIIKEETPDKRTIHWCPTVQV